MKVAPMRMAIAGAVAATAAGAAIWVAVAASTPEGYAGGPYQIYILNTADERATYAIAVDDRAAAAVVEHCVGRLLDDPRAVVTGIRERAERDRDDDDLSTVWITGEGSAVNLGDCHADEPAEKESGTTESLVVVHDASAAQVRHLIGEIHGLPEAQQRVMLSALEFDHRARR